MHKGMFVIEDWFGPYPGDTDDERWNGCATPYFEYDVALQMVGDWKTHAWGGRDAYHNSATDEFCFRSEDEEYWECLPAVTCEVEGQKRKPYPIGAFCWIWFDETETPPIP